MPTYDYLCSACGHHFEEFQSMSAKELRKCPECKKNKLDRLIGAGAGVIFKGSGFYGTDYRGDSYSSDKKKDSESADSKTTGTESGGGGKPSGGTDKAPSDCKMPKQTKQED